MGMVRHEAKRLWLETGHLRGLVGTVIRDGNANDKDLFTEFKRQRGMTLLTTPRRNSDHTSDHKAERRQMIEALNPSQNRRLRKQRAQTVRPMQGLAKEIFVLERYWMHGHGNSRCLFELWRLPCSCSRPTPSKSVAQPGRSSRKS
jgi:hypothetical protein